MLKIHTLPVGQLETNCYILYNELEQDCLVVDPGAEPEAVLAAVKALGKQITAILLTHGHFDHVGGVRHIFSESDCDIYLCPDDCQMPENMTAGPLVYTNALQDGDTLHLAGLDLQVIHTPGHTPGSVCFLCKDALFSGDTLFSGSCGRTDFPCGSWDALSASLRRLKALDGDYTVYPGHGESTKLSIERIYNPYMH